ncbi:PrpF domain-containing protein [Nonomuraea sp. NPDC049709]|uniref:PrpF domain-containing protein n=1 Tax=Nonomuraea sp. NPDC049709 TaxID=3154736 RepID=UPI00341B04FA
MCYWFAQVGIDQPIVDRSGNCGNLTSAVGPLAVDEGLVAAVDSVARPPVRSVGAIRTARRLMAGVVHPADELR